MSSTNYTDLRSNGVLALDLELEYCTSLCDEIFRIYNTSNYSEIAKYIVSLPQNKFDEYSKKVHRLFSGPASVIASYISKLPQVHEAIGSSNLIVTPISPYEHNLRPDLPVNSPDFFYRLVRYNRVGDIGLPHFDHQFWDLSSGTTAQPTLPSYKRLWKVWIPLVGLISLMLYDLYLVRILSTFPLLMTPQNSLKQP